MKDWAQFLRSSNVVQFQGSVATLAIFVAPQDVRTILYVNSADLWL
jgi:hypothetical protein